MKGYETFAENMDLFPLGKEIVLNIRSLEDGPAKYVYRKVKALLSNSDEPPMGGVRLKIRYPKGQLVPQDWWIVIKED